MKNYLSMFSYMAAAAAFVTVIPVSADAGGSLNREGNSYVVYGDNLRAVAGDEIEVLYDPDSYAVDSVARGDVVPSGAQFNPNTKEPGVVRVVLVTIGKPMRDSGSLAKIILIPKRGSGGSPLPMPTLMYNAIRNDMTPDPPLGASVPPGADSDYAEMPRSSGSSGAYRRHAEVEEGMDEAPMDEPLQPEPEQEDVAPSIYNAPPMRAPEPPRPTPPVRQEPAVMGTTVIERFRTFTGDRNIGNLLGLFNVQVAPTIRQDPPVAISDGESQVTVSAKLATKDNTTPTFALHGARLSALRRGDDGSWVLEITPTAGRFDSMVSALVDTGVVDIPLTVAPALSPEVIKEFPLTAEGFQKFMTDTTAKTDVSGDGRHDYLDDYIYSANYLADRQKPAKAAGSGS